MLYMIDSANIEAIRRCVDLYPVAGVTTNPTIVSREHRPLADILKDIRAVIGDDRMLHAQVSASDTETMIAEAHRLNEFVGGEFIVKVPVSAPGMKAIRLLSQEGMRVTATAILSAQQALMAAVAGAEFLAPYINRLDNIGGDGCKVAADIVHLLKVHQLPAKVLGASFKNVQQVQDLAMSGAQSVTVAPDVFENLIRHPLTDSGLAQFHADWEQAFGEGKTILDML
ncbi:transaldolase family protein [Celerinatantimonas sp. YJH-8]|uniref:transaldolase family protein n=1 Tax=Celerinatantimonas sp. YJH-8 TaxID=3228714 RepID=UPI0038C69A98